MRAKWSKKPVASTPQGIWERVWFETVGRWRDASTQRQSTLNSKTLDTEPLETETEFIEVLYLFFRHVGILGLTDHVDLSAFFAIVIHPQHLPNGQSGQTWEFACGLLMLMVCFQRMDTLRHTRLSCRLGQTRAGKV